MAPLLCDQERIFINKFVYRFEPIERGDVVVFWYPLDRSKSFIKRVVGLPGETIELRRGHLYMNGQELTEPYVPASYLDGFELRAAADSGRKLFCDGRSSRQFERFAGVWRGQPGSLFMAKRFLLTGRWIISARIFFVTVERSIAMKYSRRTR